MADTILVGGELEVRRLGLGAMSLTGPGVWGPPQRPDEARRVLRRALELGVNLIDTADSYGPEASETRDRRDAAPVPRRARDRDEGRLHAAGAEPLDAPTAGRSICARRARRACAGSGSSCIDLFYLHTVDPAVPLEESLGALAELRAEGKIRLAAVSNVDAAQLERARAVVPGRGRPEPAQPRRARLRARARGMRAGRDPVRRVGAAREGFLGERERAAPPTIAAASRRDARAGLARVAARPLARHGA